jgi:hypothetical protein
MTAGGESKRVLRGKAGRVIFAAIKVQLLVGDVRELLRFARTRSRVIPASASVKQEMSSTTTFPNWLFPLPPRPNCPACFAAFADNAEPLQCADANLDGVAFRRICERGGVTRYLFAR